MREASREAATGCSPRRKPWVFKKNREAQTGRKNLSHTSANILLHMIFSTQGRLPMMKEEFRSDLFAYLGGIIREMRGTALIINGTADHVHVLIRIRPAHYTYPAGPFCRGDRSCDQGELLRLAS